MKVYWKNSGFLALLSFLLFTVSAKIKAQDLEAPEITAYSINQGESEVSLNITDFSIQFGEEVIYAAGEWRLIETSTGEVIKTALPPVRHSYSKQHDLYFPKGLLNPGTVYHIELDEGIYKDKADNSFGGISDEAVWSFTTEVMEDDAPRITNVNPSKNNSNVSIGCADFSVDFDEEVAALYGDWRLIQTSTGEVVKKDTVVRTFTPDLTGFIFTTDNRCNHQLNTILN